MSPRYGLNKRLYLLAFIIISVILLGIVFHSTDVRKSIPFHMIISQNEAPTDDSEKSNGDSFSVVDSNRVVVKDGTEDSSDTGKSFFSLFPYFYKCWIIYWE